MTAKTDSTNTGKSSRRDFMKTSAVAVSAASLGTLDLSRSAHAAGSDIIRVGMIGCGGRNAGAVSQALTADKGARLVAMCDIFLDRIHKKRQAIRKEKVMPQLSPALSELRRNRSGRAVCRD